MERLICGKNMKEVMETLSNCTESITVANAKRRLESLIGACNYDVHYDSLQALRFGDSDNVGVKCTIQINDDDGKKVVAKEFFCSNEVTYQNNTNGRTPINLAIAIEKVQKEAFRRCTMQFYTEVEKNKSEKTKNEKPGTASAAPGTDNEKFIIRCKITSAIEPLPNYKNAYKANGIFEDNSPVQLIFWYNAIKLLNEQGNRWDEFVNICPTDQFVRLVATKNNYKGTVQYAVSDINL